MSVRKNISVRRTYRPEPDDCTRALGSRPAGETDLSGADRHYADLNGAAVFDDEDLEQQAKSLEGATMPNGQEYENWLKDKKAQGKDENE